MQQHRSQRVSEAVREELGEIIGFELSDPRLASVDVTEVTVSPDGRHATVRVTVGDAPGEQDALAALEHARPFLRRALANRLNLRRVPELHFQPDCYPDASARVDVLLKRAKKKRGPTENQPQN